MNEQRLRLWLSQGLSLEQIGRLVGRHPSTVAYWLGKHGLTAPGRVKHAPRGPLDRLELQSLVDSGASIAEIAESVDRSKATVRHWLARYGLRTTNGVGRRSRPEVLAARASGSDEVERDCERHGRTTHRQDSRGYFRCRRCSSEAVSRWRRKVKQTLVTEFGGRCALCGYDRSPAALEFHHLDPATKLFSIAQQGFGRSLDQLRVEAAKCVLLCSNCHAEVEHGSVSLSDAALHRG
ncbi:MAG: helix-turn-helix domain-containing protein [Solirubrobacteraceae bacterium]|jgi:transposase